MLGETGDIDAVANDGLIRDDGDMPGILLFWCGMFRGAGDIMLVIMLPVLRLSC